MRKLIEKVKNVCQKRVARRVLLSVLALVLAVTSVTVGVTLARYAKEDKTPGSVSAEEFYFTSDLLGDTNESDSLTRNIKIHGGGEMDLLFTVQNYFDELRITETDILYTVTVETTATVQTDGYTLYCGENATGNSYTGTLAKGVKSNDSFKLHLKEKAYANGDKITVKIKSTEPYTKELVLEFELYTYSHDVMYYIEDKPGAAYAELVVMANVPVSAEAIKIDWSNINQTANVLQIDTTNIYLYAAGDPVNLPEINDPAKAANGCLTTATCMCEMKEMQSISIYFFKTDASKDYSTSGDVGLDMTNGVYTVTIEERGGTQS